MLKNISQEEAVKFFVNLRAKIASSNIPIKQETVSVTVSIGIAFNKSDYHLDEILESADDALYTAKESGRNRVEVAQ